MLDAWCLISALRAGFAKEKERLEEVLHSLKAWTHALFASDPCNIVNLARQACRYRCFR